MERRYEVFRMEKLKTEGDVATRLRHDLDLEHTVKDEQGQEHVVPYRKTADRELSYLNRYMWQGSPDKRFAQAMNSFRSKLPEKRRKNGVLGAQCLISYSHELTEDPDFDCIAYFKDAQKFVEEHFGADNVFNFALHMDEATPHMTFFFVPKVDGRMNARALFGNKNKLSEWQNMFHDEVGAKYGLERGVAKTNIKNQELRTFYGKLKELQNAMDIPKKRLFQSWDTYKAQILELIAPLEKALVSLEQDNKRIAVRSKQLDEQAKELERQKGNLANELGNRYAEGIMHERRQWQESAEKNNELIAKLQKDANQWRALKKMNRDEFIKWANDWLSGMGGLGASAERTRQTQKKGSQSDDWDYSR